MLPLMGSLASPHLDIWRLLSRESYGYPWDSCSGTRAARLTGDTLESKSESMSGVLFFKYFGFFEESSQCV